MTGKRPDEDQVEQIIESGESEQIFQKAIQEQGRGQVSRHPQGVTISGGVAHRLSGRASAKYAVLSVKWRWHPPR